jgi:hypothetical protein
VAQVAASRTHSRTNRIALTLATLNLAIQPTLLYR